MREHILSTLGLALRSGSVAVGEEPVGAAARSKHARVIFTAWDAAPSSVRRAASFARAGSCLCLTLPADKDTLGRALGRSSCAMCAVTDIGFAQSLVAKLAIDDPLHYAAAAEALAIKARRARERRDEQLQHEKNLRQGRHRVHDAPPPPPPAPERPPKRSAPDRAMPLRPEERPGGRRPQPPREPRRDAPPHQPQHREAPTRGGQPERPWGRYENALPVKKGKGSKQGDRKHSAPPRRRDH